MISSATTLFFATLVINAASVLGAPLRFPDASSVVTARTEVIQPVVPIARADVVDLNDIRARKFAVPRARILEVRDLLEDVVETREPAEQRSDEPILRRFPRRHLHDFYENKREPAPVAAPVVEEAPVVRRYPRRALYDLHEKREPATTVKETTMVITKLTTHDTPLDTAAYASVVAAGIPKVEPSTSATTIISVSQTSTIVAAGSSATPTGTSTASATGSSASATATATSTATSTSASGEPTPTGSAASSASASATSTSDGAKPTDAPADPAPAATPAAGADAPAAGGDKKDEPPATPAADAAEKPTGFLPPTRRGLIQPLANTVTGRQLGVSGAALASAVRRGLPLSTH